MQVDQAKCVKEQEHENGRLSNSFRFDCSLWYEGIRYKHRRDIRPLIASRIEDGGAMFTA